MQAAVARLPQRHSDLLRIFKSVEHTHDEEACERLPADQSVRDEFYERLSACARSPGISLSAEALFRDTSDKKVRRYKADLRCFENLRRSVRRGAPDCPASRAAAPRRPPRRAARSWRGSLAKDGSPHAASRPSPTGSGPAPCEKG